MNLFDMSRRRVVAAHAAVAAAERECFAATIAQVEALGLQTGLGAGMLLVFHAVPRGEGVWAVDDRDCSRDDAVLRAVDLADASGRRLRLTALGLAGIPAGAPLPSPDVPVSSFGECAPPPPRTDGSVGPQRPAPGPVLGGPAWQRAVLTWVDLHRALACWTGRSLAATLVVAPGPGDVASLPPVYCPDRGQDFEVVTSLRLGPSEVPDDELDAAIANVLDEHAGVSPDLVESDLRTGLERAGLELPGYPVHGPGECGSPAEER